MNLPWSITDENAPRTIAEVEACRAYQRAADDGSTFAACKCGSESRGGRACLACCDRMQAQLEGKIFTPLCDKNSRWKDGTYGCSP
jgi:hypothetical protein